MQNVHVFQNSSLTEVRSSAKTGILEDRAGMLGKRRRIKPLQKFNKSLAEGTKHIVAWKAIFFSKNNPKPMPTIHLFKRW